MGKNILTGRIQRYLATMYSELSLKIICYCKMGFKNEIEEDITKNQAALDMDLKMTDYKNTRTKMFYMTYK